MKKHEESILLLYEHCCGKMGKLPTFFLVFQHSKNTQCLLVCCVVNSENSGAYFCVIFLLTRDQEERKLKMVTKRSKSVAALVPNCVSTWDTGKRNWACMPFL